MRAICVCGGLTSITTIILVVLGGTLLQDLSPAHAQTAKPTVEELQKIIEQRDAVIRNLVRRVEKLERQMKSGSPAAAGLLTTATGPAPGSQGAKLPPTTSTEAAVPPEGPAPTATAQAVSTPASPAGPPQHPPPQQTPNPPAPGQFEVSEESAERALERTLVATGALLVPNGFAEVEPLFSYTRREAPSLVILDQNRNEFTWALDLRLGLPWESQFEIGVPYNLVQQQLTDVSVAPAQQVSRRNANSFGDVTVGIAKTFLHESGWIPDLVGRITYEIPTGPLSDNQVPLINSGMNRLSPMLTAVKRQDPLVFVATAAYTKSWEQYSIQQGDEFTFLTGAFLATSPETTLRAVAQQSFFGNTKVNGVAIKGSNSVQSLLTFGASSILGRGVLADLQLGIGLTRDAPKYTVILSFPIRFSTPPL